MGDQIKINFLSKLFDWKSFESFVADIYRGAEEVEVQHNVIAHGTTGAKYQIDVLVIQKTKLHSLQILVECKFWRSKVDRQIINILAAAIDDLSANKGVIFTTVGYEEGAIHYAKSKNIDIFIIREVEEKEWGKPGRHIWFYLQEFNGRLENIKPLNSRFISLNGNRPDSLQLDIPFLKGSETNEDFQLFSFPELKKGDYLTRLLIGVRREILQRWLNEFNYILTTDAKEQSIYFKSPVIIKLDEYPFRYLKHPDGLISFDTITFDFFQSVRQTKMEFDRANSSDFILMVENYITKQRNFVSKPKEEETIILSDPVKQESSVSDESKVLENGSVLKVLLDYYVGFNMPAESKIQTTRIITVKVNSPPEKEQ